MDSYQAVFKRKEIKYLLTNVQLEAFRSAMEEHMEHSLQRYSYQ